MQSAGTLSHLLDKLAGERESAALRRQRGMEPFGDTITHLGYR